MRLKSLKIPVPTESAEQIAFVAWMRLQHPAHRIIAIPNGGLRNIITAARLKREGTTAGIPDLMIPSLKLFIEMKRKKGGTVSPEQAGWIEYLRGCGYRAEVCRGFDEAKKVVTDAIK